MPLWIAALLGIVEGLTEFLPVSSTGHLILVDALFSGPDEGKKAFEIVIQSGAILAVVVHYRALLLERARGLRAKNPDAIRLGAALMAAFLPAAVLGLALRKPIKALLFYPRPVAIALIVGGVAMIAIERFLKARHPTQPVDTLASVDAVAALKIGLFQCFALIPGTSRSMCTILGARLIGLSTHTAAEFSFLLAIPILGAATALDVVLWRHELFGSAQAAAALAVGFTVSFVVALVVIRGFLKLLDRVGLEMFGVYRIVLGIVALVLLRPR